MATFEEWIKKVDSYMILKIGVDHQCIADYDYRRLFDMGTSPEEAAREACIADGCPAEIFDDD